MAPEDDRRTESDEVRRGRRRSTQSHQAVLAATVAVLGDVGYTALTMEAVASAAGVSKATIYRWWPSRTSLVIEALDSTISTPIAVTSGDTRTDVRTIVQAAVELYVRTPLGINLALIAADAVSDPDAADRLAALLGPRRAAHASLLLAAVGRGDLPHDVDVDLFLDIVVGTLVHRALLGVVSDDHTVDELTDLLVSGAPPLVAARTRR